MVRVSVSLMLIAVLVCLLAAVVSADRLITIPTGDTLTTGDLKAEYAAQSDHGKAYLLNVGISRFELEGARFQDFGPSTTDAFSAEVEVMPETSFTPALAVGGRDIGNKTHGKGMIYDGNAYYLAASKKVPITGGIPVLFQDVKVTGGIGTGSLSGVFFGVSGKLPMGLYVAGEYDTKSTNYRIGYDIIPQLGVQASWLHGNLFYGATFEIKI